MRTRFWRYMGVMTLGVLLAFPMLVAAEGEGKPILPDLMWYSPKDGLKRGPDEIANFKVEFNKPASIACSKENKLKCTVEGEDIMKEGECDLVDPRKVKYDETKKSFVTSTPSAFLLLCFDEDRQVRNKADLKDKAVACRLADPSVIERSWSVFIKDKKKKLDVTEDGKAHPWDGEKAYCPDPIIHSKAYDLLLVDGKSPPSAQASSDLIRRSTFGACARVVEAYRVACSEHIGTLQTTKTGSITGKNTRIQELKDAEIAEITGTTKQTEKWNTIKSRKRSELLSPEKTRAKFFVDQPDLKGKFTAWAQGDNIERWAETQTLEDFVSKEVDNAYEKLEESTTYESAIKKSDDAISAVKKIASLLQEKSKSLRMANSLNATKTFEVTRWLRRNEESTEQDLTLIGDKSVDTNILDKIIKLAAQILGSLGVLLLIISAVMMVVSQGEETMLQKAKQTFLYTLIGLMVAFFSYTIVRFVLEFLLIR